MRLLSEPEAASLLAAYGIPVAPWRLVRDSHEATVAAAEVGYPVVVKAVCRGLAHKSDVGAVQLDLRTPRGVREAVASMLALPGIRSVEGFLVQRMISGGLEMIVGGNRDPQFGPVVMCGLGGVYTEVFRDVVFALVPCSDTDVLQALAELRSAPLLDGVRGTPARDIEALVGTILAVGRILVDNPAVASVDLNPVIVMQEREGCVAVDCLVEMS